LTRLTTLTAAAALLLAVSPIANAQQSTASLAPPAGPITLGKSMPVVINPDPLSLLQSKDPKLQANKHLVHDFWRIALNAGHQEFIDQVVAENYIQHSPVQRSGREAVKKTFSVIPRRNKIPDVMAPAPVTIVAEGDLVVLVAVEKMPEPGGKGTYTTTHFNMFRVTDGHIVEHWHPEQGAPCPDLPSAENGGPQPVVGVEGAAQYAMVEDPDPALAANKRLVFDLWRNVVDAGHEEIADLYLADDYIEHNPNGATGRDGFKAYFATRPDKPIATSLGDPLVAMVAEGDLVVQIVRFVKPNPYKKGETYTTAWFDMFRIADGRLAEHWDADQKPGTNVQEFGVTCNFPLAK
jgi:predicted SnoaL-like aldol condensation-catalyzing enzyme